MSRNRTLLATVLTVMGVTCSLLADGVGDREDDRPAPTPAPQLTLETEQLDDEALYP